MGRTRVSTTVDSDLLAALRERRPDVTTAVLIDAALAALLARDCSADVDATHERYDARPHEEPDAWGDLASFREAAART
jgi:hypothetical protein